MSAPTTTENLLTVKQVAKRLGCCTKTVYRLIETKEVPAMRIGKALRIDPADLERFFRQCRI